MADVVPALKSRSLGIFSVRSRIRGVLLVIGVGAAATSVLLEPVAWAYPVIAVLEVLLIVGFAMAGYLLLQDPTQGANGRLLIASALLQVITHLRLVDDSPLPMIAWLCGPLSAMPAAVVLLRFPGQRLDPLARAWTKFHLVWLVTSRLTFTVPTPERRLGWWPALPMSPDVAAAGSVIGNGVLSASTLFFAFLLVRRILRMRGVARHELMPVTIAAVSASVSVMLHLVSVANSRESVPVLVLGIEQFGLAAIPAAFIGSAIAMRLARASVADLLLRVNHLTTPKTLQAALAETLSDPELRLHYRRPPDSAYLDVDGHVVEENHPPGRVVVVVDDDTEEGHLARIVTDPAIIRHKNLLDATVAATRLTLQNLTALAEVRQSRARIVQAGSDERRRLERNLHDGAQQRLLAIKMLLEQLMRTATEDRHRARLLAEDAIGEVREVIEELRDLARGLHPAVLTRSGLAAAVESAIYRLRVPVAVSIPERRWPEPVEGAAYFFISEGLNNVVKHAGSDGASVLVTDDGTDLVVEVSDRGPGGADETAGSGLVGLVDRIAAVGGTVDIISNPGEGTCLRALIPCTSP